MSVQELTKDVVVYSHDNSKVYYNQGKETIFYVATTKWGTRYFHWENMNEMSEIEFDILINHYTIKEA